MEQEKGTHPTRQNGADNEKKQGGIDGYCFRYALSAENLHRGSFAETEARHRNRHTARQQNPGKGCQGDGELHISKRAQQGIEGHHIEEGGED